MSQYLIKTTEIYRCDTEKEANDLIKEAKASSMYTVTKTSSEIKTLKQKGEIIDEWRRVTITKCFNEEKEPSGNVYISYSNNIKGEAENED